MQISSSRKPVRSYTLLGYYVGLVWPKITFLKFTVRPVIEYADGRLIPDYLSDDVIKRVQRSALRKIYSEAKSYTEALQLPNL